MKIIRGVEQGSEEWLALRAGRVTASNFGKMLAGGQGKTRRAYMLQLLAERLTGAPVETYTNAAMEWGTETEPRARAVYELLTGREVEEVTMIVRDEYVSASPDGLFPGGGLEIKCPKTETHLENFLAKQMPSAYKPQVQGLHLAGRGRSLGFHELRSPPPRSLAGDDRHRAEGSGIHRHAGVGGRSLRSGDARP